MMETHFGFKDTEKVQEMAILEVVWKTLIPITGNRSKCVHFCNLWLRVMFSTISLKFLPIFGSLIILTKDPD